MSFQVDARDALDSSRSSPPDREGSLARYVRFTVSDDHVIFCLYPTLPGNPHIQTLP